MNKNDIEIINNILDIDKKIYTIYAKLSELEENEDDKLFNKYKYMLKILIASENNLYNNFNKSYEHLSGCLEYISSMVAPDFNASPIYAICDYEDVSLLNYYRIYQKLKMLLMNNNRFIAESLDDDLKIFESNKDESLNYIKIMNYNLAYEYHKMNMLFLSECDDLRVVKRKYTYSFLSPLIENEMIDDDFVVTKCNFWDNLRTNSKYNIFENYIFTKFGMENAKLDLNNLLEFALIDDFDILDCELSEDMVEFNSIVCSFKTSLLFLSNEDIIELRKWIVFFSNDILGEDHVNTIEDLENLENISDEMENKIEKVENIKDYIENILDNVNIYRQQANKDGKGKTYRLG